VVTDYRFDPLWLRLNFLSIDAAGPLQRLVASRMDIGLEDANRLIEEYRRFLFLALRAGHAVMPPPMVNQVWTLHIENSANYWGVLSELITERPVTQDSDSTEVSGTYEKTVASYSRVFGTMAPERIWPSSNQRRGAERIWQVATILFRRSE
jgi:hypothetical protein